jgi:hypothetical protein
MARPNISREAEEKWKKVYTPILKDIIYRNVKKQIKAAQEAAGEGDLAPLARIKEDFEITTFFGKTYYFASLSAIEQAAENNPFRFVAENREDILSSIADLTIEEMEQLSSNFWLMKIDQRVWYIDGYEKELDFAVPTIRSIEKGLNTQTKAFTTFMATFEPYYSAIYENDYYTVVGKSEQEKNIVEDLINATAPAGFKSIIDKEEGANREFIDLVIDQITKSVENIVEDQKLIEEVYEEIKLSLKKEQATRDALNALAPRSTPEEGKFKDVLVPKQNVDPKPLKPFEHQCYLLENIRAISSYKDNLVQNEKYKNIGAIFNEGNGRNNLPGNLISYINHANKTVEVNSLLNLCPEIYALLTPHIKIFRVEYSKDPDKKLFPVREQEIPFPNFIDPSDIEAIMNKDYGRFPGAGIKSFNWNLNGVNPAEVENNISATLKLHFQTVQDLFSLNQGLAAGQDKPGYLDLIIKSSGVDDNNNTNRTNDQNHPQANRPQSDVSSECFEAEMMSYDPRDYEIKACVGWSTPPGFATIVDQLSSSRDKGPNYGIHLEAAINKTRLALFLTLTSHELNFNENGTVDLTVYYQARLSGLARSTKADIFAGGSTFTEDIAEIDKKLEDLNKQLGEASKETTQSDPLNDPQVQSLREEKKKLLEQQSSLVTEDKAVKYKKFLNRLYCTNKIYSYKVPFKNLELLRDKTPEDRAKAARQRVKEQEYLNGYQPQNDAGATQTLYENAAKEISAITKKDPDQEEQKKASPYAVTGQIINRERQIPFFYLGDLIDEILNYMVTIIDSDAARGSLQIILSQVELLDPLLAYQIEKLDIKCPNAKSKSIIKAITEVDPMRFRGLTGIKFTTNIGSLPISLELFQEWFINTIVKSQVETFHLLRFIKTICSSLIGKAFNSICFKDGVKYNLRFDSSIFNFDKSFTGKLTTVQDLAKSKANSDVKDCGQLDKNTTPSIPTFLIYSVDSRPLTGNYDDDLKTGIYHYYLGAACGIAKKISFQRVGMPYYREARLQRQSALSALQLREMYSANIDMIGNNLHKNGQYIYINPVAIGAGSLQQKGSVPNLARLLGIGGYYMVSSISHNVSSDGFNVQVQAIQEGIDFSAAGNSTVQLVPYIGSSILNPKAKGS